MTSRADARSPLEDELIAVLTEILRSASMSAVLKPDYANVRNLSRAVKKSY